MSPDWQINYHQHDADHGPFDGNVGAARQRAEAGYKAELNRLSGRSEHIVEYLKNNDVILPADCWIGGRLSEKGREEVYKLWCDQYDYEHKEIDWSTMANYEAGGAPRKPDEIDRICDDHTANYSVSQQYNPKANYRPLTRKELAAIKVRNKNMLIGGIATLLACGFLGWCLDQYLSFP